MFHALCELKKESLNSSVLSHFSMEETLEGSDLSGFYCIYYLFKLCDFVLKGVLGDLQEEYVEHCEPAL